MRVAEAAGVGVVDKVGLGVGVAHAVNGFVACSIAKIFPLQFIIYLEQYSYQYQ